jgi:sialidase-1
MKLFRLLIPISLAMIAFASVAHADSKVLPEQTDLFVTGDNGVNLFRIPGIVVTPKGTILAYCEARRSPKGDWGEIEVHLRRSTDDGKTWLPIQHIAHLGARLPVPEDRLDKMAKPDDQTVNNPVAIVDTQRNLVHFLYCVDYARCFYMRSADEGATWSGPVEITATFDAFKPDYNWNVLATGPGHGIQLRSGRLVVPIWLAAGKSGAHHPSDMGTIFSDDGGQTWLRGAIAIANSPEIPDPNETSVAELSDGRVMLNVRSHVLSNRRLLMTSPDGATNWTKPEPHEQLWEPICFGSSLNMTAPDGKSALLFCNPHNLDMKQGEAKPGQGRLRQNVSLYLSRDDGKTWPIIKTIESEGSGYSDLAALPDGTILVFYERGPEGKPGDYAGRLTVAKVPFDWLDAK